MKTKYTGDAHPGYIFVLGRVYFCSRVQKAHMRTAYNCFAHYVVELCHTQDNIDVVFVRL